MNEDAEAYEHLWLLFVLNVSGSPFDFASFGAF